MQDEKATGAFNPAYEKPALLKLGDPAKGRGDCFDGSSDTAACGTGGTAFSCSTGTADATSCTSGGSPLSLCNTGSIVGGSCFDGGSAVEGCYTGIGAGSCSTGEGGA